MGRRGGGGGGAAEEEEEEDEQEAQDRKTLALYEAARQEIMEALATGKAPSSEQYATRDLHLYRLSDADLQAEYARGMPRRTTPPPMRVWGLHACGSPCVCLVLCVPLCGLFW